MKLYSTHVNIINSLVIFLRRVILETKGYYYRIPFNRFVQTHILVNLQCECIVRECLFSWWYLIPWTKKSLKQHSSIIPKWAVLVLKFSWKHIKTQFSILAFPSNHEHCHDIKIDYRTNVLAFMEISKGNKFPVFI